jgi:hypothetical protein
VAGVPNPEQAGAARRFCSRSFPDASAEQSQDVAEASVPLVADRQGLRHNRQIADVIFPALVIHQLLAYGTVLRAVVMLSRLDGPLAVGRNTRTPESNRRQSQEANQ